MPRRPCLHEEAGPANPTLEPAAYVLRPFAIHDPSRIYQIAWQAPEGGDARFTWREYEALAGRADLFAGTAAHRWQRGSAGHRELQAAFVSGSYFETLRPRVALGRPLAPSDAQGPGRRDLGWRVGHA